MGMAVGWRGSEFIIAMSSIALAACSNATDSQTSAGAGGATDASSAGGTSGSSAGGVGGTKGLFGEPRLQRIARSMARTTLAESVASPFAALDRARQIQEVIPVFSTTPGRVAARAASRAPAGTGIAAAFETSVRQTPDKELGGINLIAGLQVHGSMSRANFAGSWGHP